MNAFLEKLEAKIYILAEPERKKVIKRYHDEIKQAVKKGKTEEDVVASLGPLDEIVKGIYEDYHLNDKYSSKGRVFSEVIRDFISSLAGMITLFCKDLASRVKNSNNDTALETFFEIFLKIILFVMAIMVLKLPFVLIEEAFGSLFGLLFYPFDKTLDWILHFVLTIIYMACTIWLGIEMFKNYFGREAELKEKTVVKAEKTIDKKDVAEIKEKDTAYNTLFTVIKIVLFIIILLPMLTINLAFLLLAIISAFLVYKGVSIIGLTVILFGLFLLTSAVTNYITDALDNRVKSHLFKIGISVVAIVVGSILFVDNVVNFNYLDDITKSRFMATVETHTIEIEEAIGIVTSDGDVTIEIDDALADNELLIEVVYYNKVVDISISVEEGKNRDFLAVYTTRKDIKMDTLIYFYNNALEDLKKDNIFDYRDLERYELTIYCNESTRELLP